jgi:hypothetical protein
MYLYKAERLNINYTNRMFDKRSEMANEFNG